MISEVLIVGALLWLAVLLFRYWRSKSRSPINKIKRDKAIFVTIIAFLIAPLVPAAAIGIWSVVDYWNGNLLWNILGFLGFAGIAYEIAVVVTVIFALPIFLLLNWLKLIRWWTSGLSGFLFGLIVGVALNWGTFHGQGITGWIKVFSQNLGYLGGIGFVTGFVFWLIWRIGQKDSSMAIQTNREESNLSS